MAKQIHIACEVCDLLLKFKPLDPSQRAKCPRCGHVASQHIPNALARSTAFSLAAIVFLVCSLLYPFLGFSISGQQKSMTLLQSSTALINSGEYLLGLLVFLVIIVVPLLWVCILLALRYALTYSLPISWMNSLGRWLYEIRHWNMVEVFVVGVLVTLTKIAAMANIELGLSFWAFIGFTVCIWFAVNTIDDHQLWQKIQEKAL